MNKIAVIIPSYRVKDFILNVINSIDDDVDYIYVIDDACPENSGDFVNENTQDSRIKVIKHKKNLGVGAAMITGYRAAIADGAHILVKIDGDGQMDPKLLSHFILPIIHGHTDYCKGNRFYNLSSITKMPKIRIFGNAILSFLSKFSSGYWQIFDPTNGYTAIHADIVAKLDLDNIHQRYFFESDMLFHLGMIRAKIIDIPMDATYNDEQSNLKIHKIIGQFLCKHFCNFNKRIFYHYYLRDFSLASIELLLGTILLSFGIIFGAYHWIVSLTTHVITTSGTVMLSALPIIIGLQFLIAFIGYDIASVPKDAIHPSLQKLPFKITTESREKE